MLEYVESFIYICAFKCHIFTLHECILSKTTLIQGVHIIISFIP